MRIYLNIPDDEKVESEELGLIRDEKNGKWYYEGDEKNYSKLAKWIYSDFKKSCFINVDFPHFYWTTVYVCDNKGEYLLDNILNNIIKKYELGQNHGVRVLVQQPLSNYVEILDWDAKTDYSMARFLNTKSVWTKFDFLIEIRKEHVPLLAIELDGPLHRGEEAVEQKERDKFKDDVCAALDIPIHRIEYTDELDITEDLISEQHEKAILKYIYSSLIKRGKFNLSKDKLPNEIENDEEIKSLVEKRRFM